MALCPFAEHKIIAPGGNDPRLDKVAGAILHVDAGDAGSLFSYFRDRSGGIESHFLVRKDGVIEQYRDTDYEADANYKANSFVQGGKRKGFVSIETQGFGPGRWNKAQMDSIKRLLLWLSKEHDFPLRETPGPFAEGVGYHTLFGAPGPWTPVSKSCPGRLRKRQFHKTLVPWMARMKEDDDMAYRDWPKADQKALVNDLVEGLMSYRIDGLQGSWGVKKGRRRTRTIRAMLRTGYNLDIQRLRSRLK